MLQKVATSKLIVVSDAEAILGIGDWGTQGADISIGKLMVYTAASGIDPRNVLPVSLDAGTDNEELLNDPLYLGNHHKRIYGDKYYEMVDKFVESARKLFPDVLIHFEDFGRSTLTLSYKSIKMKFRYLTMIFKEPELSA